MKPVRGLAALSLLALSGCFTPHGGLLTSTTEPYYLPHQSGARWGSKSCVVDITQLKEPFSGAPISVLWTSQAVAEAAEQAGISELRYADLRTLSLFNETYVRRSLVFYGE